MGAPVSGTPRELIAAPHPVLTARARAVDPADPRAETRNRG